MRTGVDSQPKGLSGAKRRIDTVSYKNIYYPESKVGDFTDIDGTIAFYLRVNSLVDSTSVILDIGCGRGRYVEDPVSIRRNLRIFKGRCKKVIGIDVNNAARVNPFIDEFYLIQDNSWPIKDNSIDIVLCDSVLEHIEAPGTFFSECHRVIRPGGYVCIRTPNSLGYVILFSKLIPDRFHAKVIGKVQNGRKDEDIFTTFYRCNTIGKIRKILAKYNFDHCVYGYEAEPSYLAFSKLAYFCGTVYHKIVPKMFSNCIFAFGKKKM